MWLKIIRNASDKIFPWWMAVWINLINSVLHSNPLSTLFCIVWHHCVQGVVFHTFKLGPSDRRKTFFTRNIFLNLKKKKKRKYHCNPPKILSLSFCMPHAPGLSRTDYFPMTFYCNSSLLLLMWHCIVVHFLTV